MALELVLWHPQLLPLPPRLRLHSAPEGIYSSLAGLGFSVPVALSSAARQPRRLRRNHGAGAPSAACYHTNGMVNPGLPLAPCPARLGCAWSENGRRHFPHPGLTRDQTRNGNARYLPGTTPAQIQALETATVGNPTVLLSHPPAPEYIRDVEQVIGWDRGQDAALSFVECTSRTFHGRPMAPGNPKLRGGP